MSPIRFALIVVLARIFALAAEEPPSNTGEIALPGHGTVTFQYYFNSNAIADSCVCGDVVISRTTAGILVERDLKTLAIVTVRSESDPVFSEDRGKTYRDVPLPVHAPQMGPIASDPSPKDGVVVGLNERGVTFVRFPQASKQ
jgi:hypothetical protein